MNGYHVTEYSNIPSIKQKGLIPQIGNRSMALGEVVSAVYLFKTEEEAMDGIANWLGDEFDECQDLAIIHVRIPDNATFRPGADYECVITSRINPECIISISRID